MLGLVKYFAKLGLLIALIMLNSGIVLLLFGHARNMNHLIPLSESALYGAAVLIAVSAVVYLL
jgi:hypothetical protein